MYTIDIITVCKNAKEQIKLNIININSIQEINTNINWIVIDGHSTDGTTELIKNSKIKRLTHILSFDSGIYDAMNIGMSVSSSDFFIFLNAGDLLLSANPDLREGLVNCFQTKWHNLKGERVDRKSIYFPLLGKMMPHQGMFFNREFRNYKYNKELKIAGDLEIKYLVLKTGAYLLNEYAAVSSLTGGVSQLPLSRRQYFERIIENFKAQKKYATTLTMVLTLITLSLTLCFRLRFINNYHSDNE
jgi:glycosyltransferase involved in cell wall biosynthesis